MIVMGGDVLRVYYTRERIIQVRYYADSDITIL
jgi:hypothetical protein